MRRRYFEVEFEGTPPGLVERLLHAGDRVVQTIQGPVHLLRLALRLRRLQLEELEPPPGWQDARVVAREHGNPLGPPVPPT